MAIWVIHIPWFRCQYDTVQTNKPCNNIHSAFQCVCKYCNRVSEVPCYYLPEEKNYGKYSDVPLYSYCIHLCSLALLSLFIHAPLQPDNPPTSAPRKI